MKKSSRKVVLTCNNCEVNPAEILLINGDEFHYLCSCCGQESIYKMAKINSKTYINNNGTKDGITELELQ